MTGREKGSIMIYYVLIYCWKNSNLESLGEVSELSEFSGTSSSTNLTENSIKEEQIDLIYFSCLMAKTRKTIRLEEGPGTSGAGG